MQDPSVTALIHKMVQIESDATIVQQFFKESLGFVKEEAKKVS